MTKASKERILSATVGTAEQNVAFVLFLSCLAETVAAIPPPSPLLLVPVPTSPHLVNYQPAPRPVKVAIAMTQVVSMRTTNISMASARRKAAKSDGRDAKSVPTILAVSAVLTILPLLLLTM